MTILTVGGTGQRPTLPPAHRTNWIHETYDCFGLQTGVPEDEELKGDFFSLDGVSTRTWRITSWRLPAAAAGRQSPAVRWRYPLLRLTSPTWPAPGGPLRLHTGRNLLHPPVSGPANPLCGDGLEHHVAVAARLESIVTHVPEQSGFCPVL